jgi:hypothetical protein
MRIIPSALRRFFGDFRRGLYFGKWGAIGGLAGAFVDEISMKSEPRPAFDLIIHVGLWFGTIGASIAIAILVANERYSRKPVTVLARGIGGLILGCAFGWLSGVISGAVAQTIYGIGPTEILRVICWGIAGGLLGMALGFRIPNLTRSRGFAGGFAGRLAGGSVFIGISVIGNQAIARHFGIAAIGFAIGLMIILADAFFREAWLEVRYGPHEALTVTLGADPVRVGSDARKCEVYVRNVPAIAYIYRFEKGQVLCDNYVNNKRGAVPLGVATMVGNVSITPLAGNATSASMA